MYLSIVDSAMSFYFLSLVAFAVIFSKSTRLFSIFAVRCAGTPPRCGARDAVVYVYLTGTPDSC